VLDLLRAQGAGDILVTGGGIMSKEDILELEKLGTGRLFGPGSSTQEAAEYIRNEVRARRARRSA
jgi:methylmalonyl-CoA mutase C-terminal domain/subunit